jgi:hypothetical protein
MVRQGIQVAVVPLLDALVSCRPAEEGDPPPSVYLDQVADRLIHTLAVRHDHHGRMTDPLFHTDYRQVTVMSVSRVDSAEPAPLASRSMASLPVLLRPLSHRQADKPRGR